MKTLISQRKSVVTLIMIMLTAGLIAQENRKIIKKDFIVNENTKLELSNKYGNVNIINTTEPKLTIEVQVKVDVRDKDRAKSMLDMVQIDISQEGDLIHAETQIEDDINRMFRGFNMGDGGLQIDYTVTMPKNVPLNLSNKYGNVVVDELTGTSTLDIKYGKLNANKIIHDSKEPLSKVYLSYSEGAIQETRWLAIDIKYSKISITESKALAVMSKYSKVFVTNGSSIVSESKYDTYEIGKLNNFITNAGYGHFTIAELSGKLQVESKYTDVNVGRIPANFESIKVTNSYGTFKLGIDQGASYRLNGYAKYCELVYPQNNARVSRFDENNELKVNGTIGGNSNPSAQVDVDSHYGTIRLVQ
jgi:hypothetical protein